VTRPRLVIAWPTYNRPESIADHLAHLSDEVGRLGIPIYISDDSSDDATEHVVARFSGQYKQLHYRRNRPGLGHDVNLIATLKWPDADYVWLLGDRLRPKPDTLARLIASLDDQDFMFVDSHANEPASIRAVTGEKAREFVRDRLWHQTLTGATVYSRRVLNNIDQIKIWRNFPQVSVILSHASQDPISIGWLGSPSIAIAPGSSSYWHDKAFDVFVDDWAAVVTAFPKAIPPQYQKDVIRSHAEKSHFFNVGRLLAMRQSGQFNWRTLRRPYFLTAMKYPFWKLAYLLLLPKSFIELTQKARRKST
jgi:glycosyltransferase involved in cell wall biosynthesis